MIQHSATSLMQVEIAKIVGMNGLKQGLHVKRLHAYSVHWHMGDI